MFFFGVDALVVYCHHRLWVWFFNIPIASPSDACWCRRDALFGFHSTIRQPRSLTAHIRWLIAYLYDDFQYGGFVGWRTFSMETRRVKPGMKADGTLC